MARNLLMEHLEQRRNPKLERVLHVIASTDRTEEMKIIMRGIHSGNPRERSNSIEALEYSLDSSLTELLIPVVEIRDPSRILEIGREHFNMPDYRNDKERILKRLFGYRELLAVLLTLYFIASEKDASQIAAREIERLAQSDNRHIRTMARRAAAHRKYLCGESDMEDVMSIPDKIIRFKRIDLFQNLHVNELAALASVTEDVVLADDENGGTCYISCDGLYIVLEGRLSLSAEDAKGESEDASIKQESDCFGLGALFRDEDRRVVIRTAFRETVLEHPRMSVTLYKSLAEKIEKFQFDKRP
jgi:CRP-like cAMP-binding protein